MMRTQQQWTMLVVVSVVLSALSMADCQRAEPPVASCPNNRIDTGEDCDGQQLGGKTCESLGHGAGTLLCGATCHFDTTGCAAVDPCGNGKLDEGENCDGDELGGKTCDSLELGSGTLHCTEDCHFDATGCESGVHASESCLAEPFTCSGQVSGPFHCDFSPLGWVTVRSASGQLFQTTDIMEMSARNLNAGQTGDCFVFANNDWSVFNMGFGDQLITGMVLDEAGLLHVTCPNGNRQVIDDLFDYLPPFDEQVLHAECETNHTPMLCADDPAICTDGSKCVSLSEPFGDEMECATETPCHPLAYESGCSERQICQTSAQVCVVASVCGDGVVQNGESCDGDNLYSKKCEDFGYWGGTLGCIRTGVSHCDFDFSGCRYDPALCGNGAVDPPEQCDGVIHELGCDNFPGFRSGVLACTSECRFDLSGCRH